MNTRFLFLLALSLLFINPTFSQNPTPQLSSYVPVSPNAASLGKFGMYPVNYNLGTVNIGVPIYTINTGKQQLPISLSYHSSGIKVNELASWVGLGWTLNSGGAIIRNTKGIPDKNLGAPGIPDMNNYAWNETNYTYLYQAFTGLKDMAPDEFVINAPGLSGTFYFDSNDNNKVVFRDYNQVKVDVISNSEVKITREDGTIMYFGASDESANEVLTWTNGTSAPVTSWYLREIITADRSDTISFTYKTKLSADYPVAIGESAHFGAPHFGQINGDYPNQRHTHKKYLEKIEFKNGVVRFNSSLNRPDLADEYQLDSIKVYFVDDNNSEILVEEFNFDYGTFSRANASYPSGVPQGEIFTTTRMKNSREKSLKLNKITIGTGNIVNEYSFDYNTTQLPYRGSKKQDYWGYANNNSGSMIINTSFIIETFNPTGGGSVTNYSVGNGNRKTDINKIKAASLEKITYPTGGYTKFEYDIHKYNATDYIGGLRIKSIKNYDGVNTNPISIKSFGYAYANILQPAGMNSYIKKYIYKSSANAPNAKVSTNSNFNNNIGGVPIVEYKYVNEYDIDPSTSVDNGKTVYTYETIETNRILTGVSPVIFTHPSKTFAYTGSLDQIQDLTNFAYYEPKLWEYGSLKKKEVFKRTGSGANDFQIISSTEHDYTVLASSTLKSNVIFPIYMDPTDQWYPTPNPYNPVLDNNSYQFSYFEEEVSLGKKALSQTKQKVYAPNGVDFTETITDYSYNDNYMVAETETTTSEGKTLITKTRYPDDIKTASTLQDDSVIKGGGFNSSEISAINAMKSTDLHQIAIPLQVETYKKVSSTETLLSIQRNNFDEEFTDVILPESVETSKGAGALEERIEYTAYYNNGNVKEVTKTDGSHIVYIWGYREQFPVAKIENATFSDIPTSVYNSIITWSDNDNSTSYENILRSYLDKLRNPTDSPNLSGALVTTYTYDPLIGVTSITDPTGYTMFYEYDDFNRLKRVKDDAGKILSENEYHYKGQ